MIFINKILNLIRPLLVFIIIFILYNSIQIFAVENIDKLLLEEVNNNEPILNISLSPQLWSKDTIVIKLSVVDNGSGNKNITLPNGSMVSGTTATFSAEDNGFYSFKYSNANNKDYFKGVTVSTIDRKRPDIEIINDDLKSWKNNDAKIIINAIDN